MTLRRWLVVGAGLPLIVASGAGGLVLARSAAAPVPAVTATAAAEQLVDRLMSCEEDLECAQAVTSAAGLQALQADVFSAAMFASVDRAAIPMGKSAWCHAVGHMVGSALGPTLKAAQATEQLAGIDWAGRLAVGDAATCQAGVLHGTLDGWATRGDVADLGLIVDGNCREYGDWPTIGAGHLLSRDIAAVGCIHGLGHAVGGALLKSGEPTPIPQAWKWCSRIEVPSQARNCLSGAVMALNELKQNTDPESCRTIPGDAGMFCAYQTAYYQRADKTTADRCAALEPEVRLSCWDGIAARGGNEYVGPGSRTIEQWCTDMPAMTDGSYEPERCAKAAIVVLRVFSSVDSATAEDACAKGGKLTKACLAGSRSAAAWLYHDGLS